MAISKRLRFEILNRDNHTCRYCGQMAPDVVLTVDHVVPTALGGGDDPSNLVAACKDCNSGKSSVQPGAAQVAQVSDDAVRWAEAMRAAYETALTELKARQAYADEFSIAWDRWSYKPSGTPVPMPSDWGQSIEKWYGLGIPIEILKDAINIAMRRKSFIKKTDFPEFSYMAGTVWGMHQEMQRSVAATMAVPSIPAAPVKHCTDPWCCVHEDDPDLTDVCQKCGQTQCEWYCGFATGERSGWDRLRSWYSYEIYQANVLLAVCDQGGYKEPAF